MRRSLTNPSFSAIVYRLSPMICQFELANLEVMATSKFKVVTLASPSGIRGLEMLRWGFSVRLPKIAAVEARLALTHPADGIQATKLAARSTAAKPL